MFLICYDKGIVYFCEMKKSLILDILKKEVVPALGCTEPVAVGLAVAKTCKILGREVEAIQVFVSGNIYKNGMGVGIPGTKMSGLPIAAALGALFGDSDEGLKVFAKIKLEDSIVANDWVKTGAVKVTVKENVDKLYVECIAIAGDTKAKAIICGRHDKFVFQSLNDRVIFDNQDAQNLDDKAKPNDENGLSKLTFKDVYDFTREVEYKELAFFQNVIDLNSAISEEGLKNDYGLCTGKKLLKHVKSGLLKDDISSCALIATSAAVDARMAGSTFPVMTNSGSGNQGITATMPIVAIADKLNIDAEKRMRAVVLSHLTTIYIKQYMGRLSAFCGVTVAATGASVGIVDLLGGTYSQAEFAISNMVGSLSGMFCDGAKNGCSLKVTTGVNSAITAAILAIEDIGMSADGIVFDNLDKTVQTLGELSSVGMQCTDDLILEKMLQKNN